MLHLTHHMLRSRIKTFNHFKRASFAAIISKLSIRRVANVSHGKDVFMERLLPRINLFAALAITVFACTSVYADAVTHGGTTVDSDAESVICLSCHDGTIAKAVSVCTIGCGFNDSHVIDKAYPPRGKERSFNPARLVIANGIRLLNGKVACISCHNLRSLGHSFLAAERTKSKLCLICHIR